MPGKNRFARKCAAVLFAAVTICLTATAQAAEFGPVDYEIYHGDLNSDGCDDLYLKAKSRFIILAGDVDTPIKIPPAGISYKLLSSNSGGCGYSGNLVADDPETVNVATLSEGYRYLSGDFNGDGLADTLLQAPNGNLPSISVVGSATTPSVLQVFDGGNGPLVHQGVGVVSLIDHNGDGRDDIIIAGSPADTVYLANSAGAVNTTSNYLAFANTNVNTADIAATDQVGSTAGSFRVDESGNATYSIPLATAAGSAGVAPQLSLNYSSQGGNGLLGLGWSIGGQSGISRSRQTLQQDSNTAPLEWSANDRFNLDGQRLILVAGAYGAPNSEYRTEIDSFAKIFARGGTTGHPDYFEVYRKDGSLSIYGANGSSNAELKVRTPGGAATSKVLTWALSRFEDSVGNHITYSYQGDSDGSGHRLYQVKYAYGSGSSHNAHLTFNYQNRPDDIGGYLAGYRLDTTQRLTSVASYNGGALLRSYTITYQAQHSSDNLSRVAAIQECVGGACLPATTFAWVLPQVGLAATANSTNLTSQDGRHAADYKPADLNGDGKLDLVWWEVGINGSGAPDDYYLRYGLSDGAALTVSDFINSSNGASAGTLLRYYDNSQPHWEVIDYNADGRMDVIVGNSEDSSQNRAYYRVYLSRPQSDGSWKLDSNYITTTLPTDGDKKRLFADINSDGLVDAVIAETQSSGGAWTNTAAVYYLEVDPSQPVTSATYYRFGAKQTLATLPTTASDANFNYNLFADEPDQVTDINGDGRVDVVIKYDKYYDPPLCLPGMPCIQQAGTPRWLLRSTAAGYEAVTDWGDPAAYFPSQFADINGDGLPDQLYADGDSGWHYRLNQGTGTDYDTAVAVIPAPNANAGANPDEQKKNLNRQTVHLADYNRDGYSDLVWHDYDNNAVKLRYWNGNGYDAAITLKGTDGEHLETFRLLMDANADAIPDYLRINLGNDGQAKIYLSTQQNTQTNRVSNITNGLGAATDISYGTLATSGHYQRVNVDATTTTTTYTGPCLPYSPYNPTLPGTGGSCTYSFNTTSADDFYATLNGEWDVQSTAHSLGKDVNNDGQRDPVLEVNGAMYVVTQVASSAPLPGNPNAKSAVSYYYAEAKLQAMGRGFLGFQRLSTVDEQTGVITTTTYRQDFPFIGTPLATTVTSSDGHLLSEAENIWKLQGWNGSGTPAKPYRPYLAQGIEKTYNLANNGVSQGSLLQTVTTDNSYDTYGNATRITVTTDDATGSDLFIKDTVNQYGSTTWDQEMGRLSRAEVTTTRNGQSQTRTSAFTYYTAGSLKGLLHTETIEPDNSNYTLTTTYDYDSFGNKLKATTTGGGQSRYTRSEYDSLGRYANNSYNGLEHLTRQVVARNGFGAVTQARDIAGVDSYAAYSTLGRQYLQWSETGGFKKNFLSATDLTNCPTGTAYKAKSQVAGGGESQACYDKIGRVTRNLSRHLDGSWVTSDVEYDNLGRTTRQSEPYFIAQSGPQYWTRFQYDLLGRVTQTTLPDSSVGAMAYNGYLTTETNALGHNKTTQKNALGETVQVTDNLGGTVNYTYDPQGNLTSTVDSAGNTSTISYDLLGRKTAMDDPDKGVWSYQYNHFGELVSQTDAKGQTTTLTYDALGRQSSRTDQRADTTIEGNTTWAYDTAPNGLGQLDYVQDSVSGYLKAIAYDSYGRVSETVTSLPSDGDHYEKVTYDPYGRTDVVYDAARDSNTYNDNGSKNHYNSYGHLYKVTEVDSGATYHEIVTADARGNVTAAVLGNGVSVYAGYDPATGRLLNKQGVYGVNTLQDLDLDWDVLGNLQYRHQTGNGRDLKESFCYDGLNRLVKTNANSISTSGCGSYNHSNGDVRYNGLGNITYKADVGNYSYGAGCSVPFSHRSLSQIIRRRIC